MVAGAELQALVRGGSAGVSPPGAAARRVVVEAGAPEVPGHEVLGLLGQGGFGTVYRARQLAVGREVALKIDKRVLASERDKRRFMREVTATGALSGHPHVAHVYDAGVLSDGRPYMVMELCPGGSLSDRLRRDGTVGVAETRDIGVRIADALAAAHHAGVLHRDLKPANILVNRYGNVVLGDFGLATMPAGPDPGGEVSVTRESLTPAYAPPEAFELIEPSAAGDVYSLAATLYALLSGRPPRFPANGIANIAMIMALHRLPVPDLPGVPLALTAILRHAMAPDPAQRMPSAAALRDALAAVPLDGPVGTPQHGTHAPPPPMAYGAAHAKAPVHPTGPPPAMPYGTAHGKLPDHHGHPTGSPMHGWPTTPRSALRREPAAPSRAYLAVAAFFAALLVVGAALMVYESAGSAATSTLNLGD
ncbi:serine/threonine-protein kinase [Sinosporangium siamense]|uniref:non-specific serine/threonine protein kinase n=1 Tax=Sinosporangium siamense TaxID=1367973 RepID=A0A919RQN8_9ACTN|nr:serine/threonine-protein kinase [Sinosporangium siamense]GII96656.1 hypothetical protein Ssi02_68870 [Sinosporangium siamense]